MDSNVNLNSDFHAGLEGLLKQTYHQLSQEQKLRLHLVGSEMGLRRDDPLYSLFLASEFYLRLHEDLPEKLRSEIQEIHRVLLGGRELLKKECNELHKVLVEGIAQIKNVSSQSAVEAAKVSANVAKDKLYTDAREINRQAIQQLQSEATRAIQVLSWRTSLLPAGILFLVVLLSGLGGGYWAAWTQLHQDAENWRTLRRWNSQTFDACVSNEKSCKLRFSPPPTH